MDCSLPGPSVHEESPSKNTGVGCHALLQGIFPTQGIEPTSLTSPALADGVYPCATWETPVLKEQEPGRLQSVGSQESDTT